MGRRRGDDERIYDDDGQGPIPLDPVNVLAGIAPGLELTADDLPAGIAGAETASEATISVEEVGRMLRVSEVTIRRLIRTAIIRPVMRDGEARIPLRQVQAYEAGVHRRRPDKPGE
jgi:hypothetical protein